jgi:magnesium transporter
MIRYFQKTITKKRAREIEEFKVGSWVYVENPTEEEQKKLKEDFGIGENFIADALDPNEAPRFEKEDGNVYIFARVPYESSGVVTTGTCLVVVGESFVMTICTRKFPFLEKFLDRKISFNTTQKTRFFLQVFSEINSDYLQFVSRVNRRVRGKSVSLEKIKSNDITEFVRFEITLNDFLSALVPMNTVLTQLLSGRQTIHFYEEDKDLVEDLSLSISQLVDTCRSNLKTIVNIREAYSTILTNSLNNTIRTLTILTVVLAVPTLVASFFGMNVPVPLETSPYGFAIVLLLALFLVLAGVGWFVKKRWV